jgi:hypothetical protein
MGNTIAGVFNGTEEVASLAQALAEASSNLKVAKVGVLSTITPEHVCFVLICFRFI